MVPFADVVLVLSRKAFFRTPFPAPHPPQRSIRARPITGTSAWAFVSPQDRVGPWETRPRPPTDPSPTRLQSSCGWRNARPSALTVRAYSHSTIMHCVTGLKNVCTGYRELYASLDEHFRIRYGQKAKRSARGAKCREWKKSQEQLLLVATKAKKAHRSQFSSRGREPYVLLDNEQDRVARQLFG